MSAESALPLVYLLSRYPAISHAFILREIRGLRQLGLRIHAISINPPDRPTTQLTAEEHDEALSTFYVKSAGLRGILLPHLRTLVGRPLAYFRGLLFALRLGGADLRKLVFGLFYLAEAVSIGYWMQARGISHLHVHFATPAATVALIASRIFPITFSMTVHGPDEFYDTSAYCLPEKIAGARFVCCIGLYARSQLMQLSPPSAWGKFEIVPLGVDPTVFVPASTPAVGSTFEVLCVGRLVAAKGQYILVEAVAQLIGAKRPVRLRLIGDGPDRAGLEAAVRRYGLVEHIVFEGAVNQDRLRAFYAAAHGFALASFAEGIPVVLMEAMAMGLPCISTTIAGIPELIRHGIDGLLVPPSDAVGLAQAIATLMDDPALRHRLALAGRQRVLDKFDLRHNVMRLAEVFRQRLGEAACVP